MGTRGWCSAGAGVGLLLDAAIPKLCNLVIDLAALGLLEHRCTGVADEGFYRPTVAAAVIARPWCASHAAMR
jgi:hypothetical protein